MISDEYHYYDMVKFLEAHGITEVKGKTYKDIVFEILYKRAECEIQVAKIDELKPGSYKMYYTQRLSLTSYFKSLGEELPFATDIKHQYSFEFKKVGLRTSNKVYTQFLKHLQEKTFDTC
ncbi:MAG: hypothetical protein QY308_03980 [Ignavibacteriaceae bacterium]|nr:MAG: hypothetical protein QY308_03980 [Ignavibacteriaceae bacterium]